MIQKGMPSDPGVTEGEGRLFAEMKACPVLCRSEGSLLLRPWSAAGGAPAKGLDLREPDGSRWRVTPGAAGMPTPFDHAVFRTCEWVALEGVTPRGGRFSNPFTVRIRDLCERLHLKEMPASAKAIQRSLKRLSQVEILETPPSGTPSEPGLLRRRLFSETTAVREDGGHRAMNLSYRIAFDTAYVRSVTGGCTLALNWRTWHYLRTPVARRLMELLTCAFASQPDAAALRARELATLIPLGPDARGSKLRQILDKAHEELAEVHFIAEARWERPGADPVVAYTAGPSHRAVLDRVRPARSASILAWELASELTDAADAGAYQQLVERTDPRHLLAALSEIRILRKQGLTIPDPRSFFLGRMKQSMERERRAHRPAVS